jgi:hypothetical protein
MSDFIFNIAKGKIKTYAELALTNDALVFVLVKSSGLEADSTLKDYDDLSALLAGTTDECDFTNYARKTLTSATITVDDTNDRVDIDVVDLTWTSAGGATNNTVGALIVCYDNDTTTGTDSAIVPISKHDLTFTTDGTDQTVVINAAGLLRAA